MSQTEETQAEQPVPNLAPIDRMLPIHDVCGAVGLSKAQIYKLIARDEFPDSIKYSAYCVRWRTSDINAWIEDRIATNAPPPQAA